MAPGLLRSAHSTGHWSVGRAQELTVAEAGHGGFGFGPPPRPLPLVETTDEMGDLCRSRDCCPKQGRHGEGGTLCSRRAPNLHLPPPTPPHTPQISCHAVTGGAGKSLGRGRVTDLVLSCRVGVLAGPLSGGGLCGFPLSPGLPSVTGLCSFPDRLCHKHAKTQVLAISQQGPGMAVMVSGRLTHLGRRRLKRRAVWA